MSPPTFPPEIANMIFGELGCTKDKAAVSQSCKHFHDIIQPLLYEDIKLINHTTMSLLLRSILRNRSLANHIKNLYVTEPDNSQTRELSPDQIQAFHITRDWPNLETLLVQYLSAGEESELNSEPSASGSKSHRRYAEIWIFKCCNVDNWDALTAVLLVFLPRLERLDISRDGSPIKDINFVIAKASSRQYCNKITSFTLPSLTEINLGKCIQGVDTTPFLKEDLLASLRLRSLRTIVVDGIADYGLHHELDFRSSVQHLTLKHCSFTSRQIEAILYRCDNLKELHIGLLTNLRDDSSFLPSGMLSSLLHLRDCLESLTIIDEEDNVHNLVYPVPLPRIKDFRKLHTLEVTADLVFGRQIVEFNPELSLTNLFGIADLPQSIVKLTLFDTGADMIKHLILAVSDPPMPNLKNVHVQFRSGSELYDDREWLLMARGYQQRSIVLTYSIRGVPNSIFYTLTRDEK